MKTKAHMADAAVKERIIRRLTDVMTARDIVRFAFVYGSFTEETPFHDIDVAVYLVPTGEAAAIRDAVELSNQLSNDIGMPVDVRPLNAASIPFRYRVIRGRLLFERDSEATAQFVEQTVQRYLDIKPFLLRGMKEAFANP